jgi:hypothetical protein
MTTTYIGYFHAAADSPVLAAWRETGAVPTEYAHKVNEFLTGLPSTCKWIGTWNVSGDAPSAIVVEVESNDDLQHINQYYAGWLAFTWHPTTETRRDN